MNPDNNLPTGSVPTESLTEVLGQAEHVKDLVEQSATELTAVNTSLKHEMARDEPSRNLHKALLKSRAVEEKMLVASDKLAIVTQALEEEVGEREELQQQLSEITEQELEARHAALHDPLTGLANRSLFNDRLEHGLAQAKRLGLTLAVMFMDLDGFKAVNDDMGHDVGDALLQTVADRLKENTRDDDTVSRVGGDEFLYLVMGANDTQALARLAQKIVDCIQAPCVLSAGPVNIKLSMGIARYPQDGDTADVLVKQADMAMYKAKREQAEFFFAS